MIATSFITIALTRDEYVKLLADTIDAAHDPDHPVHWFASLLGRAGSDDIARDVSAELRRRHNILSLGTLKPGVAA